MKNILLTLALTLCAFAAGAQERAGLWHGRAQVGPQILRLSFELKNDGGQWAGAMQSPDQSPAWIPMSAVALRGDTLRVEIAPIGFAYTGIFEGETIRGAFTQGGATFPLALSRETMTRPNRPQEPAPPFPYAVEEVAIENEAAGIVLAGTLTVPRSGEGPFPAVVLVSGSGAQDRDEALAGHRPFFVLADYLTRRGIVVLRYDDRGTAASGGDFARATIDSLAGDARAALRFLQAHPQVDTARAGVIGHSEGGLIALMLASEGLADFIVTLAGPGVDGRTLIDQQRAAILHASGADSAFIVSHNRTMKQAEELALTIDAPDELRRKTEALLTGTSLASAAETLAAQLSTPGMKSFLRFDPADYYPRIACPVLALNGELDLQVPAAPNLEAIRRGLAHDPHVTTRAYPGLNHLFQHASTGLSAEYGAIEETMAPEVPEDIGEWIVKIK